MGKFAICPCLSYPLVCGEGEWLRWSVLHRWAASFLHARCDVLEVCLNDLQHLIYTFFLVFHPSFKSSKGFLHLVDLLLHSLKTSDILVDQYLPSSNREDSFPWRRLERKSSTSPQHNPRSFRRWVDSSWCSGIGTIENRSSSTCKPSSSSSKFLSLPTVEWLAWKVEAPFDVLEATTHGMHDQGTPVHLHSFEDTISHN